MSIINANPCKQKAPTIYTLQEIDDLDWIKNPNSGDIAILVTEGATAFWVFVIPVEDTDPVDAIAGGCQGAWVRGGVDIPVVLFGADPTGESDSTEAFQMALDYGVLIFIPPGIYRLSETLVMRSRTTLYGSTPENGSNIAGHRTTLRLYHADDGITLSDNPASAPIIKNVYIERQSGFPSSNALIRFAEVTGARIEGCWGFVVGTGQGVVIGPNTFLMTLDACKFYGDGAGAIGIDMLYPTTVTLISNAMVSFSAGIGIRSATPDNDLYNVNFEFNATAYKATTDPANMFGPYGTTLSGCHLEQYTVAGIDVQDIATPMDFTFVSTDFVPNGGGVDILEDAGGRAKQDFKYIGGTVGSPVGNVNATISGRMGGLQVSTEPYPGGTKAWLDIVYANSASYIYYGLFGNTQATGDRYIEAFRYTGGSQVSFLLINSLSTFTYHPSGASPTIVVTDPQDRDDWANLDPLGGLVFGTSDQSGSGPGPVAGIKLVNLYGTVSPFGALAFYNAGTNRTLGTPKMIIDYQGWVGMGSTQPAGALDVNSVTGCFLPPRMSTAQRDAITAANGMMIFNDSLNKFQGYAGGSWVDFH